MGDSLVNPDSLVKTRRDSCEMGDSLVNPSYEEFATQ